MMISVFDRGKKRFGTRRKFLFLPFSPFPAFLFSRLFFLRVIKTWDVVRDRVELVKFNFLPNDRLFDWSILKAFADDKMKAMIQNDDLCL